MKSELESSRRGRDRFIIFIICSYESATFIKIGPRLGESEKRLEYLGYSLDLTPDTDHSFLTKATAYWSDLVESGKRKQALGFLIDLSRQSPPQYQEEIKEMFEETALATNGATKRKTT